MDLTVVPTRVFRECLHASLASTRVNPKKRNLRNPNLDPYSYPSTYAYPTINQLSNVMFADVDVLP